MAMKAFSVRLAPEGIAVFEVRPGIIRTDMTAPVAGRYDERSPAVWCRRAAWGEAAVSGQSSRASPRDSLLLRPQRHRGGRRLSLPRL